MKSGYFIGLFASVVGAGVIVSGAASAASYVVSEPQNNVLACYEKVYVPATVQYNTRGILVQHSSVDWVITGDRWQRVRSPAVYIETRHVLEEDHYKLVPCR